MRSILAATRIPPIGKQPRGLIACLLLVLLTSAAAPPDLTASEQIGPLRLGMTAKQIPAWPGCKAKLGPDQLWGADGAYHQSWSYPACGVSLDMVSDKPKQAKTIASISLSAPSKFATRRGIRIGSSEQQARKAYAKEYNAEESQSGQSLVFGSIYGGLICNLEKGKVKGIFLGAAAE